MPARRIPNEVVRLDETTVQIIVTRRNGDKFRVLLDYMVWVMISNCSICVSRSSSGFYARFRLPGDNKLHYLHRAVVGGDPYIPPGLQVDHRNPSDRLDNRLHRLRVVTPLVNAQNRRPRKEITQ